MKFKIGHKQKKIMLSIILVIITILIIIVSALIWTMAFSYSSETAVYEKAREKIIKTDNTDTSSSISVSETGQEKENETAEVVPFLDIDFDALSDMCPDMVGWLDIPDTNISYPVVKGSDNNSYLSIDAFGNSSSLGAIYLNFNNSDDFNDYKSIIYGHNMRNGTMFHDLRYYGKLSYAKEHMNAYLYLPDGTIKIYTFITSGIADSLDLNIYALRKEDNVQNTLNYFSTLSDSTTNVVSDNNILILSTCTGRVKSQRRVVIFQEL